MFILLICIYILTLYQLACESLKLKFREMINSYHKTDMSLAQLTFPL